MISLRDLINRMTGGNQLPPIRPTSLQAARMTGNRPSPRPGTRQEPPAGSARTDSIESTAPRPRTFNEQSLESTPRRSQSIPQATRRSRRGIAAALGSPALLRQAIVLREVLDEPVALRRDPPN